jgi:hypothetical protein
MQVSIQDVEEDKRITGAAWPATRPCSFRCVCELDCGQKQAGGLFLVVIAVFDSVIESDIVFYINVFSVF